MTDLNVIITIDGTEYTHAMLKRHEYAQALHVLHEMKQLGYDVHDGAGKSLSHIDINWLEPDDAIRLCLDNKMDLGEQGFLDLYAEPLKASDAKWHDIVSVPIEEQGFRTAVTEFEVHGIALADMLPPREKGGMAASAFAMMNGTRRERVSVFPEHFLMGKVQIPDFTGNCETFGMYGEPTLSVAGAIGAGIPAGLPYTKREDSVLAFTTDLALASDNTPIHLGCTHEFAPLADGFRQVSTFFCPARTPEAMADGHKIHFAIEMLNDFILAHKAIESRDN